MQNPIFKFRQTYDVRKTRSFVWKIENFDELQLPQSLIFLLNFCSCFLLNNVYKSVFGIFSISFRSWVFDENVFCEFVETRSFYFGKLLEILTK